MRAPPRPSATELAVKGCGELAAVFQLRGWHDPQPPLAARLRRARGARRAHGNRHQAGFGVVTALDPVQALVIGSAVFRSHLENTPRVPGCLLEIVDGRLPDATAQRSAFPASGTLGRIAARIVELSHRYAEPGVAAD